MKNPEKPGKRGKTPTIKKEGTLKTMRGEKQNREQKPATKKPHGGKNLATKEH